MNEQRTGVGEYAYELLSAIFLLDRNNEYYLFYNSSKDVSKNIPKWNYENMHFVATRWPNKLFNLLVWLGFIKLDNFVIKKLFKNFKLKISNLDIWFSPNLNFTNLTKGVEYVLIIHDLSFEINSDWFSKKRQWWHKFLNPKKQCERADLILTPSENTRRDVVDLYSIAEDSIQVVCPGVCPDVERGTPKSFTSGQAGKGESLIQKYNLPKNFILYLGTIEPRKNIESIIDAFIKTYNLLPKTYNLVVAGAKGWNYNSIMKKIEQTENVRYIGYVDDEDKKALYSLADLFVFPSFYEGFGLPVLEAMVCNTPVMTSSRSSLPEVVDDSAYLVNPNNVEEMARGMKLILNNNKLKYSLIEKGKRQVKKFSWQKTAQNFLELIKEYDPR